MSIKTNIFGKSSIFVSLLSLLAALLSITNNALFSSDLDQFQSIGMSVSLSLAFTSLALAAISFVKNDPIRLAITGAFISTLSLVIHAFLVVIGIIFIIALIYVFINS